LGLSNYRKCQKAEYPMPIGSLQQLWLQYAGIDVCNRRLLHFSVVVASNRKYICLSNYKYIHSDCDYEESTLAVFFLTVFCSLTSKCLTTGNAQSSLEELDDPRTHPPGHSEWLEYPSCQPSAKVGSQLRRKPVSLP
jgi:hypothetical protein